MKKACLTAFLIVVLVFPVTMTSAFFRISPSERIVDSIKAGETKIFSIKIFPADPNNPVQTGVIYAWMIDSAYPNIYKIQPERALKPFYSIGNGTKVSTFYKVNHDGDLFKKDPNTSKLIPIIANLVISAPEKPKKFGLYFGDLIITYYLSEAHAKENKGPINFVIHCNVHVKGRDPLVESQEVTPNIEISREKQVVTADLKNTGDFSLLAEKGNAFIKHPVTRETLQTIPLVSQAPLPKIFPNPEDAVEFSGNIPNPIYGGNYDLEIAIDGAHEPIDENDKHGKIPITATIPFTVSQKTSEDIWGQQLLFEVSPPEIERFFVGKSLSKRLLVKNNSTQKLKVKAEYPTDGWLVVDPAEFTLIGNREIYLDFKNPNRKSFTGEVVFTAYNELGEAVGEPVVLTLEIFGK